MAVSANKYNRWVSYLGGNIASNPIAWETDTVKVALCTTTYTPSAAHTQYADLTNEVANGNGYTTGGAAVTVGAVTNSSGTDSYPASMASPTWTASSSGFALRYIVFWDDTPTNNPLILYYDYGSTLTLSGSNGDTFTISLSTANLFTVA
jgi:hypothetical protein